MEAKSAVVINIWGETEILTAELSTATAVNFKDLEANSANIKASSGAVVELPKTENINLDSAPGAVIK